VRLMSCGRLTNDLVGDIKKFLDIVKKQRKEKEYEDLKALHSKCQTY